MLLHLRSFSKSITRRKLIDSNFEDTKLNRCLSTTDLIALGIGSTLGAGVYVLSGEVAKKASGPSIILSFLVAAVASVLAGLCYAEFGARVPRAGSAYMYSYVSIGELCAFVTGWNLILSYVIGASSVARAWSATVDGMLGSSNTSYFLKKNMPIGLPYFAEFPDFIAAGLIMVLAGILALGVKESTLINKVFTVVNIAVIVFVILVGLSKSDLDNWNLNPETFNRSGRSDVGDVGQGGFFPFGVSGTLAGAATCFYAFVGFDCIATTGEEVKDPQRSIPISIVVSLLVCFVAYFGVSSVLTLMIPYPQLDTSSPLPKAFECVGMAWARYLVAGGSLCALSTSLMGSIFPMPRIAYAMAEDGLLFSWLGTINSHTKTPLVATILLGFMAALMALLFDLESLVDMMSIGTLMAYSLVAACVLILRYRPDGSSRHSALGDCSSNLLCELPSESVAAEYNDDKANTGQDFYHECQSWSIKSCCCSTECPPSANSSFIANVFVAVVGVLVTLWSAVLVHWLDNFMQPSPFAIVMLIVFSGGLLISCLILWRQPQNSAHLTFKVPLLPFLPILSVMVNVYLMMTFSGSTWVRFSIWMVVGKTISYINIYIHTHTRTYTHLQT
uniref:Cationic amino acid transporter C-terminal domain-containing protein n=1 Tax=Eptatretus burgeri TaxID=7764 RepID=A0A8C4Q392_EPTBU